MRRKMRVSLGRVVVEALEGRLFLSGTGPEPTNPPDASPPALDAPLGGPVPAAATHFLVTVPASATAGSAFTFSISARDVSNGVDTTYSGTVHFTATDGQAVLPADAILTNGFGSFSATLKTAGSQKITATDTLNSSITGTSPNISVSAAAATHFTVSAPSSATAGSAFNFTVTAQDLFNNVATGYGGTVHFTSSDGQAVLPANSTLTNGVGTFSATLKTAGSRNITATDTASSSITGASNGINVNPAAATHFLISAPPSAVAGTAFSFAVTAQDQFNNTASGYAGTVHFTSSDGNSTLPANSTLTAGIGNFIATFRAAGNQTLIATDTVTPAITGTSNAITVSPRNATHYIVSAPSSATAGTAFNFTVTALDAFNNTATGYGGTVHFTSSDGNATLPSDSTLSNGTRTFSATLRTAGNQTLIAADTVTPSITGTSNSVNVASAAATHFNVTAPASATAGTAFNFTVTALDQFNNKATGYSGIVHFTSSDGQAVLPANSTLTNGTGTFSATLKTAGTQTITATDTANGSITGTSTAITVNPAAATHFALAAPANAIAGTAFTFTVTALDQFNNTSTGYAGTVHFTSTDGLAVLPANATLTNGTRAFSATLKIARSQTLTATDTVTSSITGTSNTVAVDAAAATRFIVATPQTASAGFTFSFSVTAFDQFNNPATGYTGTVHFTSSDAQAVLPGNSTLTNGSGLFSGTLKTAGARTITATDTANAALTGTSNTITVNPASPTHFGITAPAVALANGSFSFSVTALDQFNNTVPLYPGTVHFTSTDGNATLPANSTLTNGTGTFSATLKTPGNRTITATDTTFNGSITGSSNILVQAVKATVSAASLGFGAGKSITLQTAGDGLRLLPAGRNTSIPFTNVNQVQIALNQTAILSPGDVSAFGLTGGNYGPIGVTGSGTQFTLTFAKPVGAGDRLTLTIGNSVVATFVRRLDVLPGDASDDGTVGFTDLVAVAQHYNGAGSAAQGDFNGDGTINFSDLVTLAQNYNTSLPPVPAAPVGAAESVAAVVSATTKPLRVHKKTRMEDGR